MNTRIPERSTAGASRWTPRPNVDGALNSPTKEIAELAASLVLRCDDCISYHVFRCRKLGLSLEEVFEVCDVGLVLGDSIIVPHSRRAGALLDGIAENKELASAK